MENDVRYHVSAFYRFCDIPVEALAGLSSTLTTCAERTETRGLVILAPEGVNGTIAGTKAGVREFELFLRSNLGLSELPTKQSFAKKNPFRRFKVDLRSEIVTIGDQTLKPTGDKHRHLTPEEWHQKISNGSSVILDTRNRYETRVGKFRGAIDPSIGKFSEFSEFVRECGIPKNAEVLMYCTGGIRCEKAILEMERQGYNNVYQLEGGILSYIEQFPEGMYDGECFVFDHRVAVDRKLQPSMKFGLCPHCGDPAPLDIVCGYCGSTRRICEKCNEVPARKSCSKNCEHHLARRLSVE